MKRSMKLSLPLKLSLVLLSSILLSCIVTPRPAHALSVSLPSPELNFPKGKQPQWAPSVLQALNEPQTHYLGGLISYWPPEWGTYLNYNGDTSALNTLLTKLGSAKGLHLAVSFTRGTASNAAPGSWTVKYSQTTPDKIMLIINLNSTNIDLAKLQLPEY